MRCTHALHTPSTSWLSPTTPRTTQRRVHTRNLSTGLGLQMLIPGDSDQWRPVATCGDLWGPVATCCGKLWWRSVTSSGLRDCGQIWRDSGAALVQRGQCVRAAWMRLYQPASTVQTCADPCRPVSTRADMFDVHRGQCIVRSASCSATYAVQHIQCISS